jgi:predicted nucleic acid-binding protein
VKNRAEILADTNFIIYLYNGNKGVADYLNYSFAITTTTKIELLGRLDLPEDEKIFLKSLISKCEVLDLDREIVDTAIHIKQLTKTKLADSIIAASSIVYGLPLITADKGFKNIPDLDLIIIYPSL